MTGWNIVDLENWYWASVEARERDAHGTARRASSATGTAAPPCAVPVAGTR